MAEGEWPAPSSLRSRRPSCDAVRPVTQDEPSGSSLSACAAAAVRVVRRDVGFTPEAGARRYMCATGPGYVGAAASTSTCLRSRWRHLLLKPCCIGSIRPSCARHWPARLPTRRAERLRAEIADAQAQLETLAAMYGERVIRLQEWAAARTPVDARIKDAKRQLGTLSRSTSLDGFVGNAAGLRDRWEGLPLHRQHAIVAAVLDHLVVGAGRRGFNGFDPAAPPRLRVSASSMLLGAPPACGRRGAPSSTATAPAPPRRSPPPQCPEPRTRLPPTRAVRQG